jgi:hypothetical protein
MRPHAHLHAGETKPRVTDDDSSYAPGDEREELVGALVDEQLVDPASSSCSVSRNTGKGTRESHTIQAVTFHAAGKACASTAITVTVR